jgi:hypothetical protein
MSYTRLGIQHTYPEDMRLYWIISQHENKNIKPEIPPVMRDIDENKYEPEFAPKLCRDNPVEFWRTFSRRSEIPTANIIYDALFIKNGEKVCVMNVQADMRHIINSQGRRSGSKSGGGAHLAAAEGG